MVIVVRGQVQCSIVAAVRGHRAVKYSVVQVIKTF